MGPKYEFKKGVSIHNTLLCVRLLETSVVHVCVKTPTAVYVRVRVRVCVCVGGGVCHAQFDFSNFNQQLLLRSM